MTTPNVQVGVDLVRVSRITESLELFGERFLRRIFTDDEIAYATSSPAHAAERLAARFAAKEATIKALQMADEGINWRDIEVRRTASGACELMLRGAASECAGRRGTPGLAISLSHEGDYATAVVVACARDHQEP